MMMTRNEAFLDDRPPDNGGNLHKVLDANSSFKQVTAREHFIAFPLPHSFHSHLGTAIWQT